MLLAFTLLEASPGHVAMHPCCCHTGRNDMDFKHDINKHQTEKGKVSLPELTHVSHSTVAVETHHWLMFSLPLTESSIAGICTQNSVQTC